MELNISDAESLSINHVVSNSDFFSFHLTFVLRPHNRKWHYHALLAAQLAGVGGKYVATEIYTIQTLYCTRIKIGN